MFVPQPTVKSCQSHIVVPKGTDLQGVIRGLGEKVADLGGGICLRYWFTTATTILYS